MYMGLNNVLLGLYLIWTIINGIINKEKPNWNTLKIYLPVFLFFILALIASVNNTDAPFYKHLESYWSFLLIPVAFSFQQEKTEVLIQYAFKGFIYGCAATLILCYANAVVEIIINNEPWSYFLRWRHLSHDFTEIADTHPAYLGLFICTSTFYLLFKNPKAFSKWLKIALLILFSLGLLQLASRTALLIYILLFGVYFVFRIAKFKKQMAFLLVFLGIVFTLFFSFGSNYLKDRIFSIQSIEKDDRFERLQALFEVFKESPIFGVGFENIDSKRVEKYTDHGYIIAAHYKYNAHNQFMDYLCINGLLGATTYLFVFIYLAIIAFKQKDYLFLFIILSFFIANITESMMVRIKGIEYFSLFVSLFLRKHENKKEY
jgi:O-antigen ligase